MVFMASQTGTMPQPWLLDAYHDLVAASLVTPPHMVPPHHHHPPPPPSATSAGTLHPHHLMGSPLTSSHPLSSPIASPLSPGLPLGSQMLTPLAGGDGVTLPPTWSTWDALVATTPTQIPCHPETFYYLDPAWFG